MTERLDRIEAMLEILSSQHLVFSAELRQTRHLIDANTHALDRTQQLVDANTQAIEATNRAAAEMREDMNRSFEVTNRTVAEMREDMNRSLAELGQYMFNTIAQAEQDRQTAALERAELRWRFQQFAEQAERDRNQADIDRAEFRSTVQHLLQVLTQQFNGNGHQDTP